MPTTASSNNASTAGIETSASGERHIPSSTRADGSVRKEIKVRPGYRPPEDVEVYKNRTAEAWKNRGKGGGGGVPGAQFVNAEPKKESKSKKKKQKGASEPANAASSSASLAKPAPAEGDKEAKETPAPAPAAEAVDPEEEKEKQARKLSKKLRQARDLAAKKESGESLLPEQFEKVIRINELIRQLDSLGFDADGQKKT